MDPERLLAEAERRLGLRDYHGAIHLVESALASGRGYADAHHLHGVALALAGRLSDAVAAFDRALAINPRYAEARLHRGLVLADLGRSDEAATDFSAAQEAGPRLPGPLPAPTAARLANLHADLAQAYHESGLVPEAIGELRRALVLAPIFHDLRVRLARWLLEAGDPLAAADELGLVTVEEPGYADAQALLGLAHYLAGEPGQARETWEALLARQPESPRVEAYLAMLSRGA